MPKRASLVWTRPALDSLLDVVRHIQRDNPSAAQRLAATIKSKVTRLTLFPESGRVVPEFHIRELREVLVDEYRIIYRIVSPRIRVEILAVRHGARLLESPPEAS
ncbi:MAG TPA: type II toxin-antitoxin system RelE/ParE family toxin [Nitrospiraceae bacterium]|nr:type II toxin-antitoxin system RelE/ParE family toxin [Nitrospiraceae bacterium]